MTEHGRKSKRIITWALVKLQEAENSQSLYFALQHKNGYDLDPVAGASLPVHMAAATGFKRKRRRKMRGFLAKAWGSWRVMSLHAVMRWGNAK
jgi:hypothetical protein